MEATIAVVLILVLFLIAGAAIAFSNHSKINDMLRKVDSLEREVQHQASLIYTFQRFKTEVEKALKSVDQKPADHITAAQSHINKSSADGPNVETSFASQKEFSQEDVVQEDTTGKVVAKLDKLLDEVNMQMATPQNAFFLTKPGHMNLNFLSKKHKLPKIHLIWIPSLKGTDCCGWAALFWLWAGSF